MEFKALGIMPEILKVIKSEGYIDPSPIQVAAIPLIMDNKDVLGSALTGTGKTAAFAIPIIQHIAEKANYGDRQSISALVLAPTRELAEQIKDTFLTFSKHLPVKTGAIYGGVSQKHQVTMLDKGIDILVATPGRLIDLIKQKVINLINVKTFVLDEADTMLDMGFIKDVKHIYSLAKNNTQTLMFSATISSEVSELGAALLRNPIYVETTPPQTMLTTISHTLIYVEKLAKRDVLLDLLVDPNLSSVLVFSKTKHGANKLNTFLQSYGVTSDVIHSNKSQNKRQNALNMFKAKKIRVLVATDIAARGIDIAELSHVINFDVPLTPETYVHRIGRTGRAGLIGAAITLSTPQEKVFIKAIRKTTAVVFNEIEIPNIPVEKRLQKLENYKAPAPRKYMEEKKATAQKKVKQKQKKDPLLAEAHSEDKKWQKKSKVTTNQNKKTSTPRKRNTRYNKKRK